MSYKMEPHRWVKFTGVGRDRCVKCGLVSLHNKFTEFCIKMGCNHTEHQRYQYERDHCQQT